MKPLSKKERSFSLMSLLTIFIIGVPFLLAYSSGYRLDFEDFSFVKTGGVFIHSNLSDANVFLNDEFSESGGTFLKNILVQNLKSNEIYSIRVEKDGYYPWYKDLLVSPNLVTEARVLMIPVKIPFEKIEQFVFVVNKDPKIKASTTKELTSDYEESLDMFTSTTTIPANNVVFKEQEIVIISTSTKTTSVKATTTKKIIIPDYLEKLKIENVETKKDLKEFNKMVSWLEDGNIHAVWSGDYESTPFFMCDTRGCRDKVIISLDTDIESYDFYPGRNDVFLVSSKNHIFAVEADDRSKQNMQVIYEGKNPEFLLKSSTIYVKDGQDLYKSEI